MLIAVVSMLIDGVMTGVFLGDDCLAAYGLTNPVISCYLYVILLLAPTYLRAGYRFSFRYFSLAMLRQVCGYGLLYLV